MSHNIAILLAIIASIVTICTSLPDYHKQMSPTQLQSVFHVDSVNAVPHYEVVQLLHHSFDDGVATASLPEHYRRRRRRSINSVALDTDARATLKEPHHVKKDLSKNPYYSELKAAANAPGAGGVNSLEQATRGKFPSDLRELKEHKVSFNAFGENLNLTLKHTDSLFKGGSPHTLRMWTVRDEANATHGLDMEEVYDEDAQSSDQIGQVYQDETNMAAILMRRHLETGDLIMEGSIGHEMVIKPLPHELSPNPDAAHHVVYKREAQPLEHLSDFAFMEPDDLDISEKLERRQRRSAPFDGDEASLEELDDEMETLSAEATNTRNKRQVPYIIYPEVLVIIDYDGYRLHGGDNLQVKRYFISFWNGVDLRYRLLKGPRIRISIAGIIISRGRDATPYLERNRVGRDAIDSAAALTDMGKYLFRERRLPVYDIAVAITKLDMCRRTTAHGECNRGTAGFAYVGGACVVNKRLEKVNSVAIIEDTGGFSGIIVAAHEVGHLLGAVHDGSPPPSYLGGPGAQRCRWEDGYIMSDLRHTERGFRWSPCTIQSFHHFLNGDTATCLHNAPHEDSALGRALPGTLLSLDAQCRRDRGTYACFKDERVCAQLFCFDAQTGYCVAYRPAAEGSTCGTGLQCLDGRCTPLTSNVIPAYRSYNENSASSSSAENIESSSEEDEDGDNDGGEYINSGEQQNVLDDSSHQGRFDGTVEKTSREIDDSSDPNHITTKTVTTTNTHTPTQTNSLTSITLETHSRHGHNKNNNRQRG
ncbi:A disintegrin and metalloproteinase with thrombospondin motifs like isoform X4 [Anastrepha obliqua]|uniref:A disintegrin and metalloproteinase with thrombospondin motifs like isoform X4 n=1 Tax=Anastrepha obliqua TaxID=95512 RepID=UPI00240938E0|nr:A disintegrin and metalloproteinase with thrombospondin motifs like isoform X4 [Anastrepha obliqua]